MILVLLFLESVLLSINIVVINRVRIFIGVYGKGKFYIVLMIFLIFLKRDLKIFEKFLKKIEDFFRLKKIINNYYESDDKILFVVIIGFNISLL